MYYMRIAKRILEARWGPLDMLLVEGSFAKYRTDRNFDFKAAASAHGKVQLCRFRVHFTYTHWLWMVLDIKSFQTWRVVDFYSCEMGEAGDDPFQILGLTKERDDVLNIPSSWGLHTPYEPYYFLLETGGVHREWRASVLATTRKNRKFGKLSQALMNLVYSHLGFRTTL
jgi:hypothetical protein